MIFSLYFGSKVGASDRAYQSKKLKLAFQRTITAITYRWIVSK